MPSPFIEIYEPGEPLLVLLHGTGGNESEFLEFGKSLLPGAGYLSLRGKELEGGGTTRWFRRLAEGIFDVPNLEMRARELGEYVMARAPESRRIAVGFSNGANVANAAMLLVPGAFEAAVLFAPMVAIEPAPLPDLSGKRVLMVAGERDPMVPIENAERLAEIFRAAGADVDLLRHPGGHSPNSQTFRAAQQWLADHVSAG